MYLPAWPRFRVPFRKTYGLQSAFSSGVAPPSPPRSPLGAAAAVEPLGPSSSSGRTACVACPLSMRCPTPAAAAIDVVFTSTWFIFRCIFCSLGCSKISVFLFISQTLLSLLLIAVRRPVVCKFAYRWMFVPGITSVCVWDTRHPQTSNIRSRWPQYRLSLPPTLIEKQRVS